MKISLLSATTALTVLSFAAVGCTKSSSSESDNGKKPTAQKKVETSIPGQIAPQVPQQPAPLPPTTVQTQGQAQLPIDYTLPKSKAVVIPPVNGQIQQQVPTGATAQAPQYFRLRMNKGIMIPLNTSYTYGANTTQRDELPALLENINDSNGQPVLPGGGRTRIMGTFYANDPFNSATPVRSVFSVTGFIVDDKTIYNTLASGFVDSELNQVRQNILLNLLVPTAVGAGLAALGETYTGDKKVDWRTIVVSAASGFTTGALITETTKVNMALVNTGAEFDICFGTGNCTKK
jgi:hypothetical protein